MAIWDCRYGREYKQLVIREEERGRSQFGENSSDPNGDLSIFIPEGMEIEEIFYSLNIITFGMAHDLNHP